MYSEQLILCRDLKQSPQVDRTVESLIYMFLKVQIPFGFSPCIIVIIYCILTGFLYSYEQIALRLIIYQIILGRKNLCLPENCSLSWNIKKFIFFLVIYLFTEAYKMRIISGLTVTIYVLSHLIPIVTNSIDILMKRNLTGMVLS